MIDEVHHALGCARLFPAVRQWTERVAVGLAALHRGGDRRHARGGGCFSRVVPCGGAGQVAAMENIFVRPPRHDGAYNRTARDTDERAFLRDYWKTVGNTGKRENLNIFEAEKYFRGRREFSPATDKRKTWIEIIITITLPISREKIKEE